MLLRNFNTVKHWKEKKPQKCTGATVLLILLHRRIVVPVNFIKPKVLQRKRKFTPESVFMSFFEHKFKYNGNVFCGNRI